MEGVLPTLVDVEEKAFGWKVHFVGSTDQKSSLQPGDPRKNKCWVSLGNTRVMYRFPTEDDGTVKEETEFTYGITLEKYSWQNRLSSVTLENGVEITDHIINGPLTISQRFLVTAISIIKIPAMVQLSPVIYLLMELRKTKQIMTVITSYGIHRNMAIQSMEAEVTEGYRDTLVCDISFKEVIFADTQTNMVKASSQIEKTANVKDKVFNKSLPAPKSGNIAIMAGGSK